MRGVEDGARGGWGGGVSEELQWTALQRMTARTEKKKLERREKSKTNRGDCEKVHHRYAETHSRSLKANRRRHANTVKHVASDERAKRKQSAKRKSHDRENSTGLGHASTDKPFFLTLRSIPECKAAPRARRGHLGKFGSVLKPAERHLQWL